ncbi:hypothetical protein FNB15_10690 [Ferrovibrio terrae]|uniref:DUF2029 domain-containing protein n=1 Tax=Ferrovibrio terrae TaxID=2594003 RepID=A0A516H1Q1_9PROT|nr:hypothetical protein [Ferrovibrio terrae]QDO97708.1 hypothetical protein FNB15_10690 [Ferrovibrio terrae]
MSKWKWPATLYLGIVLITALPFFAKRFAEGFLWPWAAYAFAILILLIATERLDLRKYKIANSNLPWLSGAFILATLNFVLYPLTRTAAHPSTAPNALIDPAVAFFEGQHPYAVTLFDGAPISPGPGWIILNAPITLTGMIFALIPVYMGIACYAVSRIEAWRGNALVLFLVPSICFLQMNVVAHDLLGFSLAGVALTIAAHQQRNNMLVITLIAILSGIVATARLPFFLFPVAIATCLFRTDRAKALVFATVAVSVLIAIHGIFYLWADRLSLFYQPAHVFGRAANSQSPAQFIVVIALWIVISIYMWLRTDSSLSSWFLFVWAILFVPFATIGFAELFRGSELSINDIANWEGKGYVYFTVPFLAAALVLLVRDRQGQLDIKLVED